jgi:hypothetical protein
VTQRAYAAKADDGIDVTHMAGAKLTASDAALLRKYQDTLYLSIYWPDVEHFRACVAAYDAMIARPQQ